MFMASRCRCGSSTGRGVLGRGPGAVGAPWLPAPISGLPEKLSHRPLKLSVPRTLGGHVKT